MAKCKVCGEELTERHMVFCGVACRKYYFDRRDEEITGAVKNGEGIENVAKKFNIAISTVQKKCYEKGMAAPRKKKKQPKIRDANCVKLNEFKRRELLPCQKPTITHLVKQRDGTYIREPLVV